MLLLVPYLLLLARGTAHPQNTGTIPNHGGHTPTEYRTSFSCVGRVAGYYADIESGCQLYHLCDGDGRRFTHSCPNATLFQQRMMICDHWYMVNCNKSVDDYSANLLIGQRDKPFVGDDHNHHREPVSFFSISSLQQPNWFPIVKDRSEQEPEDAENTVPSPPSTIPEIHIAHTPTPTRESKQPSSQRQSRNRNINFGYTSTSPPSTVPPHYSSQTTNSRYAERRIESIVTPEKVSIFPQHPQTRPPTKLADAYTNNPFFQSLVSRTTPSTPSTSYTAYTLSPGNSRVQTNYSSQQNQGQKLQDIANIRVSYSQTSSQQTSNRRTKEFGANFETHRPQNFSQNIRSQKIPNYFSSNLYSDTLPGTRTPEISTTTPRNAFTSTSVKNYNEDDLNNIVELHLLDPRRMFYIPESKTHEHDIDRGSSTVLYISVPAPSRNSKNGSHGVMHFRKNTKVLKGQNPQCPKCHPAFLVPGRCYPCVIIR